MIKKILFTVVLVFIVAYLFIQYKQKQNIELSNQVHVLLSTQGSMCETNQKYPIEISIQNNSSKTIVNSKIKYSSFENSSKMYGENESKIFHLVKEIGESQSIKKCIQSPTKKSFYTLTKKDIQKDGDKIRKNFPNATVGFNVYNSGYSLQVDSKSFDFK